MAATVTYNSSNYTDTLTPSAALAYNTTYTATVSGAKDSAGDPMSGAFSWSFTTDPAAANGHERVTGQRGHERGRVDDGDRNVQRGGAIQHDQLHLDHQRGQSGGGDSHLQQLEQHGHIDPKLGLGLQHDLHGDGQRCQG